MKLLSLQRHCQMDVVFVRHIMAAFQVESEAKQRQDIMMNKDEVNRVLNSMFDHASQEVSGDVTAPEETCSLMFRLFERGRPGYVSAQSLQTALITLSADNLQVKYRCLINVLDNTSGFISRSGLRSVLQDLSQVPVAVQEEGMFGSIEAAVNSCFNGVRIQTVSKKHVLSWLQSEPSLLLWLPTMYRLSASQRVSHAVHCHTCKTYPIVGIRYRCKKCVNVHVCQNCYLTNQQNGKHKTHHPMVQFCTQPTWKESLSSLVRNARHALLPWRYTQRDADGRVLKSVEPGETQSRAPPPFDVSTLLADSAPNPSCDEDVSHEASVGARLPLCMSKSLQTDKELQSQQVSLLTEVRNLQRDKWLLEQQLQAWQLTVQSEQGILEDRCAEMEVTMETLRQHNDRLQGVVTQALNKMETQQHAHNKPLSFNTKHTETEKLTPTSNSPTNLEEEKLIQEKTEWDENEVQIPSLTIQQDLAHYDREEVFAEMCQDQPIEQQNEFEEAELLKDACLWAEEEDCGKCSTEEELQETVENLKTEMGNKGCTERHTGKRQEAELLEAAVTVGDMIHHLVETVRTN